MECNVDYFKLYVCMCVWLLVCMYVWLDLDDLVVLLPSRIALTMSDPAAACLGPERFELFCLRTGWTPCHYQTSCSVVLLSYMDSLNIQASGVYATCRTKSLEIHFTAAVGLCLPLCAGSRPSRNRSRLLRDRQSRRWSKSREPVKDSTLEQVNINR